ncbi:metal-dependent hydrolase [Sphingomonas cavernae]|uniref:Metal-dependent hydrolase n=1 Tax=Sphingomonas cavernae TaxID=2320861 RepID=A0A418W7K3_9SPHN|nr:metal-dependent hydrolase [Sphingomonas cavernae]RJF85984.1 metal-dependent hydrolase [Sphingomonas cavernae]
MTQDKTPTNLTITPRDRRFGRGSAQTRWWLGGDPIATAFYNALSVTFPRGEAFFVESVRAHRDGVPPKLEKEINAFIKQEVNHSREHVSFNKRVTEAGYQIKHLEQVVIDSLEMTKGRPQILNLAVTMALEHYTAIMAQQMLADDRVFKGADPELVRMWRWHAMEEIEHKGVAYDTWLHATKGWSRWKRWKVKSLMMLLVSKNFWINRLKGMAYLLKQDGIEGTGMWLRIAWFLLGKPGALRRLLPAWSAFFLPGFHPWNHDDRKLIALAESDYQAAIMPKAAVAA